MTLAEKVTSPLAYLQAQTRWQPIEIVFWLATLLPYFLFPNYLSLASQIAITALFAMSLDLILGYAGIVSLGHAAYFGVGAYAAGLVSKYGWGEPLTGLAIAAVAAGIVGYATSFVICRFRHLALIMLTTGFGLLLAELANSARLADRRHGRSAGHPHLEAVGLVPLRSVTATPPTATRSPCCSCCFCLRGGLSIRRSACRCAAFAKTYVRMPAIGAPSRAHIRTIYTIAACIAGIAGALLAQTTETVSLDSLGFERSAEVVVMLVLGGAGRLYGGLVGAIIFMVARDQFSGIEPQYWYFWIGILLVAVVMLLPNGILGGLAKLSVALEPVVSAPALATRGLAKSFGSLVVASDIEIELPHGVRYALIGPNGAGKTTLINLITGMLRPDAGRILLDDADITALPPDQRVRRGPRPHLSDQLAVSASHRARNR